MSRTVPLTIQIPADDAERLERLLAQDTLTHRDALTLLRLMRLPERLLPAPIDREAGELMYRNDDIRKAAQQI